jgi:uncharacterized protein (TIGR00369 family)
MRELPYYSGCLICGQKNQFGAKVTWMQTKEGVECEYIGKKEHVSYKGIIHGGVITALLDECIGWAVAIDNKLMCVTGELKVRFVKPFSPGNKAIVQGFASADQTDEKRGFRGNGHIIDQDGGIYAKAEGTFFPLPEEMLETILKSLELKSNPEKIITLNDLWGKE